MSQAPGWPAPLARGPVIGSVVVPGSKSATARAYVMAALAEGASTLRGSLVARDTTLMRRALENCGVRFIEYPDHLRVDPANAVRGGHTVDVGLSGTVMRFVPPLAVLSEYPIHFVGDEGVSARPVAPLLGALADLGATVTKPYEIPFTICGGPDFSGGEVTLDASGSSQFISGLLLNAAHYRQGLAVTHRAGAGNPGGTIPSRPHIEMTVEMLRDQGVHISVSGDNTWVVAPGPTKPLDLTIEPDLTNAAVFLAGALMTSGTVSMAWPRHTVQAEEQILRVFQDFGATWAMSDGTLTLTGGHRINAVDVDLHDISELTCTVAAVACVADGTSRIRGVAHIRGHETDRLAALTRELSACGADVSQTDDGLVIKPGPLHASRYGFFGTWADHRMAHTAALIGLVTPGVILDDVSCTSKTMPGFPSLWHEFVRGRE